MKEKLNELLSEMHDWEKTATSVPGVKIVKIPENKFVPARLAIEINPVDENNKPLKRKGAVVISNSDLFEKYKELFENDKVLDLIKTIDELREVTPKKAEEEKENTTFQL